MSPRPDVSEERRLQIIESAIKVISEKGFASTRMDDVAGEAGLSKGLLYWYFKSKEEIIIAIADVLFGGELNHIKNLSGENLSAPQQLKNIIDTFIKDVQPMLKITPVILEFYALAFRNKTVRTVMQRYLHTMISILEPVINKGMSDGDFKAGDAHQAALAIGALLEGTLLLWCYDPDGIELESQLGACSTMIFDSLENQS